MSIFFLIFISLFLIGVIGVCLFTKKIISKQTLWFSIPLILYMFFIYMYGYYESANSLDVAAIFNCFVSALKSFTFEVNTKMVTLLVEKDIIYAISLYAGSACSSLALIFTTLELIKATLTNDFKKFKRLLKSNVSIVLGYNDDAFKYCKNDKTAILWIDSSNVKLSKEDKIKFFEEGIVYIYAPFDTKKILKTITFVSNKINIICFQTNGEYLPKILQTLEEIPNTNKVIEFHVQTNGENLSFINEQMTKRCCKKDNVIATAFDYHELIARQFSLNHTLAKYLPDTFIKEGTIAINKNINIVMFGYGKTAKALLKSIILNNQFVQVVNGKYQCKKINIDLYDIDDEIFDDEMLTKIENFSKLCDNNYFNFDPEMGPIELTINLNHKQSNVKTDISDEFLNSLIKSENDFSFYFCCLSNSTDNTQLAEKISKTIDNNSSIIFYNIDEYNEKLLTDSSILIPFGYKHNILSYESIVLDDISALAQLNNEQYNKKSSQKNNFYKIPIIERLSNIYSELNIRFKLNLIGLDYTKENKEIGLTKEEFEEYYNQKLTHKTIDDYIKEGYKLGEAEQLKYEDYFKINLANALIYQEHLRWSMFYFLNDFKGLHLSEIRYKDGKIIHKDVLNNKHACLTSFKGLDILHRYELKLYLDNDVNKTMSKVETYQYDMKLDSVYDELTMLGYKIIKLNK